MKKKTVIKADGKTAALIIGIDGWEQYTRPLIESIQKHEPDCQLVVIDNASSEPYPKADYIHRTERLCYSAAINKAASLAPGVDWLIVLSNDVLCAGPFAHLLEGVSPLTAVGPHLADIWGIYHFLAGWCVCASREMWKKLKGWDENFVVSSWEDVDFSYRVMQAGGALHHAADFPFTHLDQRQRFNLPEFEGTHERNMNYFLGKHGLH